MCLAGICEIATRHPAIAEGIAEAASVAGLTLERLQVEGRATSDAALMHAIDRALEGAGVGEARANRLSIGPFDPGRLARALEDPATEAIVLSGSPTWSVRLPLVRGVVAGIFPQALLHERPMELGALLATVFDAHLCEWGWVGTRAEAAEQLAGLRPGELTDPNPLPEVAQAAYLSPDLAYQADIVAIAQAPGVRRLRGKLGSMMLVTLDPPELRRAGIEALRAATAAARAAHPRPPVHAYPLPNGAQLLLRDVSPGLAAWQAESARAALAWAGLEVRYDLHALRQLDQRLAARLGEVGPPIFEGWSALAGEVARRATDGRWRRVMDPWTTFPNNLMVELPGGTPLQPHMLLTEQLKRGATPDLAATVAGVLRR